ncbi:MAG TPA: glycosyltransferase family 4 protein [Candidatus Angelobacter sp.]|nr:glycosyltransferase family 4 protein [Candidatus Angelobacter sp.]
MKVLLVDLEPEWRGGQNQALLILEGVIQRGHQAELVAAEGSALGARAAEKGIRVHSVSRGLLRIPAALRIRALLKDGKFEIVHANEAHAVSAAWLAGAGRRAALVISRRVGYPIGKSRIARPRYATAARIIANSHWVAKQAEASGVAKEKLTVVHEGVKVPPRLDEPKRIAARARWGIDADVPLLGCVGVLLPDKGQEWLIRSLAVLRKEFPKAKLLLAGDGPCRSKLEVLARELGVTGSVIFAGFVKDVETVYAALDVFLLPSFFEALNNSLLAAMTYEIPSLAFDRGALGEIIEDGQSGLLVSGPNVADISSAAAKILRDRAFSKGLGEAGRRRVEQNFSAERMVEGIVRVYEDVLRRGKYVERNSRKKGEAPGSSFRIRQALQAFLKLLRK